MKKILICLLMFTPLLQAQAQSREEDRERIKALKTAFITQELNLSNKVAQEFWPIYNEYETKRRELHQREHIELKNIECISESEAENMLQEYLKIEKEEYSIKKQLFSELKEIISAQDIIKLHKLEDEFHKKLIKEYRARKADEK
ncbi:hypothetical protein [Salegentibacter chungangensis]|uniref:Sensor of ECF-type sigma factor n=1 Tax=Salegentibacter chungangensis TaxID=1335724 RepID=A0ABW3NSB3_9FLAO